MHNLVVDSVRKLFDNKLVLSDIYLTCNTGEIIGLFGRNGSGKSTLLKVISGNIAADFKFIKIDGKIITRQTDLIASLGYLPQENFIPRGFTVQKAVKLSVGKSDVSNFFEDEMIRQLWNQKISNLSGGELRYLEIKLVLSKNCAFALLDEPYNGLSPIIAEKVTHVIIENSKHKGIIVTDHSYGNVLKIATRIVLMNDGRCQPLENPQQLIEKNYLRDGMLP